MKCIYGIIATVATLVLVSIPAASAQPSAPVADTMSAAQARHSILVSSVFMGNSGEAGGHASVDRNSIRFTSGTFEYDMSSNLGKEHYTVDLKTVEVFDVVCKKLGLGAGDVCIWKHDAVKQSQRQAYMDRRNIWWRDDNYDCPEECVQAAKNFAAALNRLHVLANDNGAAWDQFRQQAAAWRALATKPPLPDAVRIQRIAAEDAIKNSHPDAAMNYYEAGLALYPTWPEGHFNAALIAAELGDYTDAAEHMQSYLELTPNAADAQAAHDQLDLWQLKAKEHKPATSK
jgi:tetratricopeptide (TPR) repeat protein